MDNETTEKCMKIISECDITGDEDDTCMFGLIEIEKLIKTEVLDKVEEMLKSGYYGKYGSENLTRIIDGKLEELTKMRTTK